MITLTTPAVINSVLGGNAPVNYDKLIVTNIRMDSVTKNTNAELKLSSTTNTDMQEMSGTLQINFAGANIIIAVPQLDFYRRILLSGPQQNAVADLVFGTENSIETGLLSLGLISGTHTPAA